MILISVEDLHQKNEKGASYWEDKEKEKERVKDNLLFYFFYFILSALI